MEATNDLSTEPKQQTFSEFIAHLSPERRKLFQDLENAAVNSVSDSLHSQDEAAIRQQVKTAVDQAENPDEMIALLKKFEAATHLSDVNTELLHDAIAAVAPAPQDAAKTSWVARTKGPIGTWWHGSKK